MSKRICSILAEVYFDSVFYPLLTEETFKREGHHFEPVDPNQPTGDLKINGIVYNEVKKQSLQSRSVLVFRRAQRAPA